jgi:hypothetical protein
VALRNAASWSGSADRVSSSRNRSSQLRASAGSHKPVSYRLGQAEALLGRPLSQDVLELGAAQLIDRTLRGNSEGPEKAPEPYSR